jgi:hypothetical protein
MKKILITLVFLISTLVSNSQIFKNPDLKLTINLFSPFITVDNSGFAGINISGIISQKFSTKSNLDIGIGLDLNTPTYIENEETEFLLVIPIELNYFIKGFIPFASIGPSYDFKELELSSKVGLKFIIPETKNDKCRVYFSVNYLYLAESNCVQFGIGLITN